VNEEGTTDMDRFRTARSGDHLILPFQCDQCHYCNIKGREADPEHVLADQTMMMCIPRANLDAFWSREKTSVDANRQEGEKFVKIASLLGIDNPFGGVQRGLFPVADTFRMLAAVALLLRSLDTGKNAPTIQFNTMRKLRTFCNNFQATTPKEWDCPRWEIPKRQNSGFRAVQQTPSGLRDSFREPIDRWETYGFRTGL
jgi:hypothetical protein